MEVSYFTFVINTDHLHIKRSPILGQRATFELLVFSALHLPPRLYIARDCLHLRAILFSWYLLHIQLSAAYYGGLQYSSRERHLSRHYSFCGSSVALRNYPTRNWNYLCTWLVVVCTQHARRLRNYRHHRRTTVFLRPRSTSLRSVTPMCPAYLCSPSLSWLGAPQTADFLWLPPQQLSSLADGATEVLFALYDSTIRHLVDALLLLRQNRTPSDR